MILSFSMFFQCSIFEYFMVIFGTYIAQRGTWREGGGKEAKLAKYLDKRRPKFRLSISQSVGSQVEMDCVLPR